MHTHLVATPAWRWQHQKVAAVEPLLKRIAAEKLILATSGGSDWVAGSGHAERVDGGYRVNARKVFASGCQGADLFMSSAVVEEEGEQNSVIHFGIPMSSPAMKIEQTWKTLGMRGTGSHDVLIDGHVVPEAAVALKRKAGEWHPLWQTIATVALPLIYSVYFGVAESACEMALDMARKRRNDPAITSLAGRMMTELKGADLARRSMIETASRGIASAESVNDVMMGRNLCARHAITATELAMEAAGGAGFYRVRGVDFHPELSRGFHREVSHL
jgi:alkylation response protein AidB-like acyl-CoA dehydrogenase